MADPCPVCGANREIVGRVHRCAVNRLAAQLTASAVNAPKAVNIKPPKTEPEPEPVNITPFAAGVAMPTIRRERGAYPATDGRREYMRAYMAKRRAH